MNDKTETPTSRIENATLCVWPACEVGPEKIAEFESAMVGWFPNMEFEYAEEFKTLPDVENGKAVPDTGGRNELLFWAGGEGFGRFCVTRLEYGIRWYEDAVAQVNGGGSIYPDSILQKYGRSCWDEPRT